MQWSEFILANVPLVASALDKMSSVAITSLQYMTEDLSEMATNDARSWRTLLEEELDIIEKLQEIGFNYLVHGNVFLSLFFPIHRTIECQHCKERLTQQDFTAKSKLKPVMHKVKVATNGMKDGEKTKKKEREKEILVFKGACPRCAKQTHFKLHDIEVVDMSRVNLILWPIMSINFINDTVTGRSIYYYKMPNASRKLIVDGFLDMIFNQPQDIIEAAVKNTSVKFDDGKVLHIKRKKMTGTNTGWGMPILTSSIPEMISLLLLRKSQERILSDMIFPLRGMTPKATGSDGNAVYNYMSGSDMGKKVEALLRTHKTNPTSIKFFPIPLESVSAFGEGKSMNLSQEIDEVSTMIMGSIGVPVEFVKGGLGYTAAGASIRILENQLTGLARSMEKVINFVASQIAVYKKKHPVHVKITPFKLIDDIAEKQILLNLYQQQKISDHTVASLFKMDSSMEAERIQEEQKRMARDQAAMQAFQQEISQNLEEKAKTEAMLSQSSTQQVNQQAIMQEAEQMAQQLAALDQSQRKSEMDRLQKENWLLYAATKERMEFNERKQMTQMKNQQQG